MSNEIEGMNWQMSTEEDQSDGSLALQESKPELKRPPLFKVVLINDDYTPMEFVVEVLEVFFRMNREQATHVMLTVHTQGKGVCGIYTRDIAETKSAIKGELKFAAGGCDSRRRSWAVCNSM